jgi:hypothetical protein
MAPPPSRAASHPRTVVAFLNSVGVFALPSRPFGVGCGLFGGRNRWSQSSPASHGGRPWRPPAGAGEGDVSLSLSLLPETTLAVRLMIDG